jgi:hypothetical protein
MLTKEQLERIPRLAQDQDSLNNQLIDLIKVANRLGMYDAADYLVNQIGRGNTLKNNS